MCEEFDSFHDRSGRLDKVMGQSIVLREIKAEVPLENDDSAYQNFLLQRYEERVQKLSQQGKVSKGTGEQFHAVACREYTLPRDDGIITTERMDSGNTKIGPVLEVTTSCLHGKHGVEIRLWYLSEENTQSWDRISHGSK